MILTVDTREIDRLAAALRDQPRQLAFAGVLALTRTAQRVKEAERHEIADVFDRPTPYTLDALYVRPATRARPEALVGVKDAFGTRSGRAPIAYLRWQITGGLRTQTAFEKALVRGGAMRSEDRAVPGKAARLDAYGNLSRGQIQQILSQLRIDTAYAGSNRSLTRVLPTDNARDQRLKRNKIRRAYGRAGGQFVAFPNGRGKLRPGIYLAGGRDFGARLGYGRNGRLQPVVVFVSKAEYEAGRFDFDYVAQLAVTRHLLSEFDRAVREVAGGTQATQAAQPA